MIYILKTIITSIISYYDKKNTIEQLLQKKYNLTQQLSLVEKHNSLLTPIRFTPI